MVLVASFWAARERKGWIARERKRWTSSGATLGPRGAFPPPQNI